MVQAEKNDAHLQAQDGEESGAAHSGEAAQGEDKQPLVGVVGIDYTAVDYLEQKGITFRKSGTYAVARCPACRAAKRTLKVDAEYGSFACSSCSRHGAFRDLRKLCGDTSTLMAGAPESAQFEIEVPGYTPVKFHRDYIKALKDRGCKFGSVVVPEKAVKAFGIGYSEEFDALVFPYRYSRSLKTVSYLRFLRLPSDWWKVSGDPKRASWFGQHLMKPGLDEVVVCRSPLQAAMLYAAGEENVVAPYGDERGVRLRSHNLSVLHRASVVYAVMDGTEEGVAWARAIQAQAGKWRCKLVEYGDLEVDIERFQAAKEKAAVCRGLSSHRSTRFLDDLDEEFVKNPGIRNHPTHLSCLDEVLGGWRPGEVTVLSGESGIGKSTLAAFLALLQASDDVPTLFMTFEVLPKNVVKKWVAMLACKAFEELSRGEYGVARKKVSARPLYVGDNYGMVELNEVRRCLYDAVTRLGVKFVVVDHLGHLCSGRVGNELRVEVHGRILREMKRWSMDLGVHVLLLAHLRKQGLQKSERGLDDLRGSAEIYQTADNVMLVERKRDGQSHTRVRLIKCRDDSGYEGKIALAFDCGSLRYSPVAVGGPAEDDSTRGLSVKEPPGVNPGA